MSSQVDNSIQKKETCVHCSKNVVPIEKIVIEDTILHNSCFICEICSSKLAVGNYHKLNNLFYCTKDYFTAKKQNSSSNLASANEDNNNNNGNASSEAETNKEGEENKKEIEKTNSTNNLKEDDKKQENPEENGTNLNLTIQTEGTHRVNQQPNSHRGENKEGGAATQTTENNEDSKSSSSDHENFGFVKVSKQDTGELREAGDSTQQPGVAKEEIKKELNKIKSQDELLGQKGEEGDEKSGRDSAPDKFDSVSETEEEDPTKSGDKDKKKKRERKKREKSKTNLFELDKKSRKKMTGSMMSTEGSESSTSKTSKKEDSQSLDASVDKERSSSKKKDRRDKRKKSVERSSRGKVKSEKSGDKKDKMEKDKLDKLDPPLGEDDDPDKKKKVKRGIFSIKKKSSSSTVNSPVSTSSSNLTAGLSPVANSPTGKNIINKKNSSPSVSDPHSITSFVSGRWRKSKKSLSSLTPNIKFEKSPTPPNINNPSHNDSNSKDIQFESVNEDNDSPSSFVNNPSASPSPAVSFPHLSSTGGSSVNLLSASHKYDKESLASSLPHTLIPSLSTDSIFNLKDFDSPISLPSIPPTSLHVSAPPPPPPLHFDPPLSFNSDLPLPAPDDLLELEMSKIEDVGETDGGNRLAWKNYSLKREFSKLKIELPKELLPEPKNEIEAIKMKGYFEKKQIKIGLIGMQNRLLELLAILHNFNSFSIVIAAVSNIPENIRSIIAERYNDPPYIEKIPDLLSKPDIEWVFIGSLYFDIFNQASASLLAGKHVFCEKPVCFSVADCLKLKEIHKKSGKHFISGFTWRSVPFYAEIKRVLESEVLGKIISIEANHLLSPAEGGYLMSDWTRKKSTVGSSLFETSCFEIDLLNWLIDDVPSKVASFSGLNIYLPNNTPSSKSDLDPYLDWDAFPLDKSLSTNDPFSEDKDIHDNYAIILQYRNSVKVNFHINTNSAFPQKRLLICGLDGTLEGDLHTGIIKYRSIGDDEIHEVQVTPGVIHAGSDQAIMDEFMECAFGKPNNCNSGEELFPSIFTVLALDQSREKQTIVDLEPCWKDLGV